MISFESVWQTDAFQSMEKYSMSKQDTSGNSFTQAQVLRIAASR